jgi:hypothetical protein
MLRTVSKLVFLAALAVGGALTLFVYQDQGGERHQRIEAERRNEQLRQVIQRLGAERRMADVIVTEQKTVDGKIQTTLLFVEYGPDGSTLPAKRFAIGGDVAYLDAMVIKFDGKFVEQNDPLRGRSIALFTRLYGEHQPPEKGFRIDTPNEIPDVYRGRDPVVQDFERELWANFWKLADDETYRREMGVRVAQGEAVWTRFQPDRLYTLTLESNGGLNITASPLKGIYREALKREGAARAS